MEGTSFSIPINRVREIMYDLAEGKAVQHGYLGISLATCTPEWAKLQNKLKTPFATSAIPEIHGALIHRVFPQTPAEKGGLRENDLVLEIAGRKVETSDDARRLIDAASVGKDLKITVLRNQKTLTLVVRPVDLASRLREIRRERQQQLLREGITPQQLSLFRTP
jgi:S1-C subfamily serine protease